MEAGDRARYEDLVGKDEASACEGGATRRWVKVKRKDARILAVEAMEVHERQHAPEDTDAASP
jgi:hypothetical protein